MLRKISIALLLMTAGCANSFIPVKTEYKVIQPDTSMIQCDLISTLPAPDTLTDTQVASLLNSLYSDNKICKNNMDQIRAFYKTAHSIIDAPVKK